MEQLGNQIQEEAKTVLPKVQQLRHRMVAAYAILPYQSDPSDTALPFEQAKSIAEGILGKKYTAYDLGSVGGLKEGGLQAAIDAYKSGDGSALQSAFDQLSQSLGTGSSTSVPVRDTIPEPGEDGYAGPKSDINPLDYSDQSGLLKDNTGRTYGSMRISSEKLVVIQRVVPLILILMVV